MPCSTLEEFPRTKVGLGLFIAKAIARAHGGGLEVNSSDDQTMFRLVLPRHTSAAIAQV
jgi:nitrogen-specific signal transduction histidine kinase